MTEEGYVMNNKMFAIITVVILATTGAGIAFYTLNNDNNATEGNTVTDALGRTVEIPENIESIFCREAGALRLVSYFSSVEKVKGLEAKAMFNELDDQTYYLVHKEMFEMHPRIALDAESIIQHNPDIIITSMTEKSAVENLEDKTKITVFAINGGVEIGEDLYLQIKNLGILFDEKERAKELVDGIKHLINDITSKVTVDNESKAYACGMFYYGSADFLKAASNYQPLDLSLVENVMEPALNNEPYKISKETVINYNPDIIVVAAYGQILPKEILDLPKHGCINVHTSLLPKYRGASPIQWAIMNGDEKTGVTIMHMDTTLDTGDIIIQEEVLIDEKETADTLHDRLAICGGNLVLEAIRLIEEGRADRVKQDDSKATYVKTIDKSEGNIDFTLGARQIERQIRGLNPWPSAFTFLDGKNLKVWEADVVLEKQGLNGLEHVPGEIVDISEDSILVKTGEGYIKLLEIQLAGKKRMSASA